MSTNKKTKESVLTIIEAVETLSSIADMDFERDMAVTEEHDLVIQEKEVSYRTVHWLSESDREETLGVVKETFIVVLNYLKNFYRDEYTHLTDEDTIEGIKTIMVLVGEAAKKLDRFTSLFYRSKKVESVTECNEYKNLQKFYQSRISQKVDEGLMGKWILGLTKKMEQEEEQTSVKLRAKFHLKTKYVFVDLETVKKDTEYELFYLRKEDGSRFFNPRLVRNMKLVSDFGNYFGEKATKDPLIDLEAWKDNCARASAEGLIRSLGTRIERFFHETARFRRGELAGIMNSAMMALIMSSHRENSSKNAPVKSCYEYFCDFQDFLWEALHSREYQKFIVYPPRSSNRMANTLIDTIHTLCRGMFIHLRGYEEMVPVVQGLLREEELDEYMDLWEVLNSEYKAMVKKMKLHPNGPLILLLNQLEENRCKIFAPLKQGNLPVPQYSLFFQDKKVSNIRIPSPTSQEFIHKVHIDELFYGFLRACEKDHVLRKHLLINLQDKTSWREIGRCQVLEGIANISKLKNHVGIVTLATDTEFYHQLSPYHNDNDARIFQQHLLDQISDEGSGYYFPEQFRKALFPDFAEQLVDAIHRIFFSEKKKLTRNERLNYIEIYYFFLILKLIEIAKPDSYSLTCKDGIDIGGSLNIILYTMLHLLNESELSSKDYDCLHYLLYIPALMNRERLMISDRFNRAIAVIRAVEELRNEFGSKNFSLIIEEAFGPLYETSILHSQLVPYHS
ncbi:MAG: hypothetical protein AAGG81_04235 [Chlamydiota bacterium]